MYYIFYQAEALCCETAGYFWKLWRPRSNGIPNTKRICGNKMYVLEKIITLMIKIWWLNYVSQKHIFKTQLFDLGPIWFNFILLERFKKTFIQYVLCSRFKFWTFGRRLLGIYRLILSNRPSTLGSYLHLERTRVITLLLHITCPFCLLVGQLTG